MTVFPSIFSLHTCKRPAGRPETSEPKHPSCRRGLVVMEHGNAHVQRDEFAFLHRGGRGTRADAEAVPQIRQAWCWIMLD